MAGGNQKLRLMAMLLAGLAGGGARAEPIVGTGDADTIDFEGLTASIIDSIMQRAAVSHRRTLTGVNARSGDDRVTGTGPLALAVEFDVALLELPLVTDPADAGVDARSKSTGVSAGGGMDSIDLRAGGSVAATAAGRFDDIDIGPDLLGPLSEALDIESRVRAIVDGVRGGAGADQLTLSGGTLSVSSTSNGLQNSVSLATSGGDEVRMDMLSRSVAVGVGGNAGDDSFAGDGDLNTRAAATSRKLDHSLNARSAPDFAALLETEVAADVSAIADATGIRGDSGRDGLVSRGDSDTVAVATAQSQIVSATLGVDLGSGRLPRLRDAVDVSRTSNGARASAAARGIDGGDDSDTLQVDGALVVEASGEAGSTLGSLELSFSADSGAMDGPSPPVSIAVSLFDMVSNAVSTAVGLLGGAGEDSVVIGSEADVDVVARSHARTDGVQGQASFDSSTDPSLNLTLTGLDSRAAARSDAIGISTGRHRDRVQNAGQVDAIAEAGASSNAYAVTLNAAPGIAAATNAVNARAKGVGYTGDGGSDRLENRGRIAGTAVATGSTLQVDADVAYQAESGNAALDLGETLFDASVDVAANAAGGVLNGLGAELLQRGTLAADAMATATSIAVAPDLSVTAGSGLQFDVTAIDARLDARAAAAALDSRSAGTLANEGLLDADAEASATSTRTVADIAFVGSGGVAGGAALHNAALTADSTATGWRLRGDQSRARNPGVIEADSTAAVAAGAVNAGLDLVAQGLALDAGLVDSRGAATAQASGILNSAADGRIENAGEVVVAADAGAQMASGSLSVTATQSGAALSGDGVDVSGVAVARADGLRIDKGAGAIESGGGLSVHSSALAGSVAVDGSVNLVGAGLALDGAALESRSTSRAEAAGLIGGSGADALNNEGDLSVSANATSTSDGASIGVGFASQGISAAVNVIEAGLMSVARALGLSGGDGDDTLTDGAGSSVIATAASRGNRADVRLDVGTAATLSAGLADLSQRAEASAAGLQGGRGQDSLERNGAPATVRAVAESRGTTLVANIGAGGAASLSGALADNQTLADAMAVGLDVMSPDGQQRLDETASNRGHQTVQAVAVAAAQSSAFAGNLAALPVGVAVADATTRAAARATGIAGNLGNDRLSSFAGSHTETYARATAAGSSERSVVTGAGLGALEAHADASASGVDGGRGSDALSVDGLSVTDAIATLSARSLTGTLVGGSRSVADAEATASAVSVRAGHGADTVIAAGDLQAAARAGIHSASDEDELAGPVTPGQQDVDLMMVGVGGADFSSRFAAAATGVSAGRGADTVVVGDAAQVAATATSSLEQNRVAVAGSSTRLVESSQKSEARAEGVNLGRGNNTLLIQGGVSAAAIALTRASSVAVALSDGRAESPQTRTRSSAAAVAGGNQRDVVRIDGGTTQARADAMSSGGSVSVSAGSVHVGESTVRSDADARGFDGRDGADEIRVAAGLAATAAAAVRGHSVDVSLAGVEATNTSIGAGAQAFGIDSGNGSDLVRIIAGETRSGASAVVETGSVDVRGLAFDGEFGAQTAGASAITLEGGAGADDIRVLSNGAVASRADGAMRDRGVSVRFAGTSVTDAGSTARVRSVAISAGDDNDLVSVNGAASAHASAHTEARDVSVAALDAGVLNSSRQALADAGAVDGGAGADTLTLRGTATAASVASLQSTRFEVDGGNLGFGRHELIADSVAGGLDGGTGDDRVRLREGSRVEVEAATSNDGSSIDLAVASLSGVDRRIALRASGVGVAGGAGNDEVSGIGDVRVEADGAITGAAVDYRGLGLDFDANVTGSSARATGVDGGSGRDTLALSGSVAARSATRVAPSRLDFSYAGSSTAGAELGAVAAATGLSGGRGSDRIDFATGSVSASASAGTLTEGNSSVVFGGASDRAELTSRADSVAVDGGMGRDRIGFAGVAASDSSARTLLANSTFSGVGAARNQARRLSAYSNAAGIAGGSGADEIRQSGTVRSAASADLRVQSGAVVSIGESSVRSVADATSTARGITGGDEDDVLDNEGLIEVLAHTLASASGATFSGVGGSSLELAVAGRAAGFGIGGGDGADDIRNAGEVTVTVEGQARANGAASRTLVAGASDPVTSIRTRGYADSVGVSGGAGDDTIDNRGRIEVQSTVGSSVVNAAESSAGLFSDSRSVSHAFAYQDVAGVSGGAGRNRISNARHGEIRVSLESDTIRTESYSNVSFLSADVDPEAVANTSANGWRAVGILTGDESAVGNRVVNRGVVVVGMNPLFSARADGNGGGVSGSDGRGEAVIRSRGASVAGVVLRGRDGRITNDEAIVAQFVPTAAAHATARGAGNNLASQPDATATVRIEINDNDVYGIWTPEGDARIINEGTVQARNGAQITRGLAEADFNQTGGGVDAFATATAEIRNPRAVGVFAESGANTIRNSGTVDVLVDPYLELHSDADGFGIDGDAEAEVTATIEGATGYGVRTGAGADTIRNFGTIGVRVMPSTALTVDANPGCSTARIDCGEPVENRDSNISGSRAIGIQSGAGDDYIVQGGRIEVAVSGTPGDETAISSGSGNDVIDLLEGSFTNARVLAGEGDDRVNLASTAVIEGTVSGDDGFDTLALSGRVDRALSVGAFEVIGKAGSGVATLNGDLSSLARVDISGGDLALMGGVGVNSALAFSTYVNGDGTAGQLTSGFTGDRFQGRLEVITGTLPFMDDQSFAIVQADLTLPFSRFVYQPASETLPDSELLDFSTRVDATTVFVDVDVLPFASAAQGVDQTALARSLDAMLGAVSGDLALTLGSIQQMGGVADVRAAYASLMPSVAPAAFQTGAAQTLGLAAVTRDRLRFARSQRGEHDSFLANGFADALGGSDGAGLWFADSAYRLSALPLGYAQGDPRRAVAAGLDFAVGERMVAGFGVVGRTRLAWDETGLHSTSWDRTLTAYAGTGLAGGSLEAYLVVGDLRPERLRLGSTRGSGRDADFSNDRLDVASVRLGYALPLRFGGRELEVFSNLTYWQAGADADARVQSARHPQTLRAASASAAEGRFGIRAAFAPVWRAGSARSIVEVAYSHDLDYRPGGTWVSFDDAPAHGYLLGARKRAAGALEAAWDGQLEIGDSFTLNTRLGASLRGSHVDGAARLELRRTF